ncbi:hypothetical protein [Kribbella sp. DT2]|uniref:hypothetical protein n=1 Tax=Kribbella sp. DT2 TaxID=3393427 RepID=UPI003CE8311A
MSLPRASLDDGPLAVWPPDLAALIFVLPFAVYVLHTLEEMQGFAAWATRHFGPETTDTFAAYHIPLMLLVLGCSVQAVRRGPKWRLGRHGQRLPVAVLRQRALPPGELVRAP